MTKLIDGNVEVVGHVPQTISSIRSLFIKRGGSITCKVTRSRKYSSDLEQDGIQLLCELTFCIADSLEIQKTRISFRMVSTDTLEVNEAMETEKPSVSLKPPEIQTLRQDVTSRGSFSPGCSTSGEEQTNVVDLYGIAVIVAVELG